MYTVEDLKKVGTFQIHFFELSSFNDNVKGARYSITVTGNELLITPLNDIATHFKDLWNLRDLIDYVQQGGMEIIIKQREIKEI